MHVVQVIANCSSVPFFNQFADRINQYPDVKFTFVALYDKKPQMLSDMAERNCDCYWIKFDWRKRKSGMISAFYQLYKLFRKLKPDVVNSHLFDDSFPALLAARLAGVKMRVIHKQDTAFHWVYNPKWIWADKFNNYNATHIVAVSNESRKFIVEKEKAPVSKVYKIHSGIDFKSITGQDEIEKNLLREKFGLKDRIVIGTVSRYIDWKGYKYIIEAARIVVPKYKNLKFLFIGQGEQQKELESLVEKYGLKENIVFTGWVDYKIMPSLYGVMDIYLHAAIMEPFGFAITEAMANRVPLVVTKTGGPGDVLIHKETCYFTEYKSSQSIADGIEWMIKNKEIVNGMKDKIEKLAYENFPVDKMLIEFIHLYMDKAKQA